VKQFPVPRMLREDFLWWQAEAIKQTTSIVVDEIKTVLPTLGQDDTFIMNIGQRHHSPNHTIAETNIMDALRLNEVRFIAALEMESISVKERTRRKVENDLQEDYPRVDFRQEPVSSRIEEIATMVDSNMKSAGYENMHDVFCRHAKDSQLSQFIQREYMQDNNIPFYAVDCKSTKSKIDNKRYIYDVPQEVLDEAVEMVEKSNVDGKAELIREIRENKRIPSTLEAGMLGRNVNMIQACQSIPPISGNETGPKIVLLLTGSAHNFGGELRDHPDFSLARIAQGKRNLTFRSALLEPINVREDLQYLHTETPELPISPSQKISGVPEFIVRQIENDLIDEIDLPWLNPKKGGFLEQFNQANIGYYRLNSKEKEGQVNELKYMLETSDENAAHHFDENDNHQHASND